MGCESWGRQVDEDKMLLVMETHKRVPHVTQSQYCLVRLMKQGTGARRECEEHPEKRMFGQLERAD